MSTMFSTRLTDLRNRYLGTLPARIAAIAESLRERQEGGVEVEDVLDGQFHALAGTAGTYGLFAIAEAATDAEVECAELQGVALSGHSRYLWSLVEELEYAIANGVGFAPSEDSIFYVSDSNPFVGPAEAQAS
jgi:HPt (histidine-containing phosphotransfer) domain-containing protein